MKRILILLPVLLALFALCGCGEEAPTNSQGNTGISTPEVSRAPSLPDESEESKEEESLFCPEEIYAFLKSEYSVTALRESLGTVYKYEYFLVDGEVAGARLTAEFSDGEAAEDYHGHLTEDYPDAILENGTVVVFLSDKDDYYYGYSLEKLKFVLEKTGHEYTVNFDEDIYNDTFRVTDE